MTTLDIAAPAAASASAQDSSHDAISYYGVHHLALNTDERKTKHSLLAADD